MQKVFLFILLLPIFLFCDSTNEYKITIGEEVYYSTFSTSISDSLILYVYKHEAEEQINYYNLDGTTYKFTYKDSIQDINWSVTKDGDNIILKGNSGEKIIDKIVKIDEEPWKQSMSYSLSEFALGNKEKIEFWIIRLDKFKGEKMQAEKSDTEDITINDKLYHTVKIKISAVGARSMFWHGHYWFGVSDGLFLRYEGLNGLPGSTKTIIELQKME